MRHFWKVHGARWRRFALGLIGGLAATLALAILWRSLCLWNLPDVGDPFDVTAFQRNDVPDSENAFVLYKQALNAFSAADRADLTWERLTADLQAARKTSWTNPSPALAAYATRNRQAMEVWKQGAERPQAFPEGITLDDVTAISQIKFLALLEAAKLRQNGDMAGAWNWYRAILRTGLHIQRRAGGIRRANGRSDMIFFRNEALTWAKDPRVDAPLLRQALHDLEIAQTLRLNDSETLQAEYVAQMKILNDPEHLRTASLFPQNTTIPHWNAEGQWYRYLPRYEESRDFLLNEPERSRRITRLIFTNWLAHAEGLRPFHNDLTDKYPDLFVTDPINRLDVTNLPQGLHDWLLTSRICDIGFGTPEHRDNGYYGDWTNREQKIWNSLLIPIAEQAYLRDHGQLPTKSKDLVGRYLPALPNGYVDPSE